MKGLKIFSFRRWRFRSKDFLSFVLSAVVLTCVVDLDCAIALDSVQHQLSHAPSAYGVKVSQGDNYAVVEPLFSDYAFKERSIRIPKNKEISSDSGVLIYPVGTEFTKTFYYYTASQDDCAPESGRILAVKIDQRLPHNLHGLSPCLIETRTLLKTSKGWQAKVHIWNDSQTSATLEKIGKSVWVQFSEDRPERIPYRVPSISECRQCHQGSLPGKNNFAPIGPRKLDRLLEAEGKLGKIIASYRNGGSILLGTGATDSIDLRARRYLDVNCSHCHNLSGQAASTGLFLNLSQPSLLHLGLCKPSVIAAGEGYIIEPGSAEKSILLKRFNSLDPDKKMPELHKFIVDPVGMELLSQWIEAFKPGCNNYDV